MRHWLVKQEPTDYPFSRLVKDGRTRWDGVRSFQARNSLKAMAEGDLVLYYHSGDEKAVVGLAEVARATYADPTAEEGDWVAVDLAPRKPLRAPVTLAQVKADGALRDLPLLKQSRLSVMPVEAAAFERILALGRTKA